MRWPRVSGASCRWTGKLVYPNRRSARRNARRLHPGEHMDAYRCRHAPPWAEAHWHIGHYHPTSGGPRHERDDHRVD